MPFERLVEGAALRRRKTLPPLRCLREDLERERRVGVSELAGHEAGVVAADAAEARVRPPQAVERQMPDRRDAEFGEPDIRPVDPWKEHVPAQVARPEAAAARRAKNEIRWFRVVRVGAPEDELLLYGRTDEHLADTGLRLRAAHVEGAAAEVDVLPAEGERFANPQAAAGEQHEQHLPVPIDCVQEFHQLLGFDPRPRRPLRLEPTSLAGGRVRRDQLVVDRGLEYLREHLQAVVDRAVAESSFGELLAACDCGVALLLESTALCRLRELEAVDQLRSHFREPVVLEEGDVLVSTAVNKSGTTLSGDTTKIVVVKTAAGYSPSPGHNGTGTYVATYCG